MGIELNVNFLFPYFVVSPQAFWRNWHISLSTWLRDYSTFRSAAIAAATRKTHRNLMITMVLGGLWHGAAWTFVLWGAYQGVVLVIGRAIAAWGDRLGIVVPPGLNWRRLALGVRDVPRHVLRLADLPRGVDRADLPDSRACS